MENYNSSNTINFTLNDMSAVLAPTAPKKTGVKHDEDKADLALIPEAALIAAAQAFMVGEKKYGRYNYELGLEASRVAAAMIRHSYAWLRGEEKDPKDGQPHLGSVIACAAILLRTQELGTLIDNRSKTKKV